MSLTVGELTAYLTLNDTEFNAKLATAQTTFQKSSKMITMLAAAAAAAAAAVVVKATKTYEDWGATIMQVTRLTGMSSQSASILAGQWKRFGVDAQSGINATKFLAKNLDSAQTGTKTMAEAFERLHIPLKNANGSLTDISTVLPEVRDRLSQMRDGAEKTRLTVQLFGRGGTAMLKWLDASASSVKAVNKELVQLNMVWGDKQIRTYTQLLNVQHEVSLQWTAFQLQLAQDVLPVLREAMGDLSSIMREFSTLSPAKQQWILKILLAAGALGLAARPISGVLSLAKNVAGVGGAAAATAGAGAAATGSSVATTGFLAGSDFGPGAAAAASSVEAAGASFAAIAAPLFAVAAGATIGFFVGRYIEKKMGVYDNPPVHVPAGTHADLGAGGRFRPHVTAAASLPHYAGVGASLPGQGADLFTKMTSGASAVNTTMTGLNKLALTATGAKMEAIIRDEALLTKLAKKPLLLGDISAKHTPEELLGIRNQLVSSLKITKNQANTIMHLMFKDWNPKKDLTPKVVAAEAYLAMEKKEFRKLGLDLTSGLGEGINAGAAWALRDMHLLDMGLINYAESDLKSHSPSMVFHQIGLNIDSGLAAGIKGGKSGPIQALGNLLHNLASINASAGAKFGSGGASAYGGSTGSGAWKTVVAQMAKARGWSAADWDRVIMRESGGSMTARNASSGAYGIAQGIDGPQWYAEHGGNVNTLSGQLTAMANYIASRYGNPTKAWAHEVSAGWYDRGGVLPPGVSLAVNTTGHDEIHTSGSGGNTFVVNVQMPPGMLVSSPRDAARQMEPIIKQALGRIGAAYARLH